MTSPDADATAAARTEQGLPRKRDPRFIASVRESFGTDHPNVVRAVDDYLRRLPGDLDLHSLSLVAASAPFFGDKNHVAYIIDSLHLTQMPIAVEPVDGVASVEMFRTVLPHFRPETRRKLVIDLVNRSSLQVLMDSPRERVPEAGRAFVRERLRQQLRSGADDACAALESPHIEPELIREAIPRLGETIDQLLISDERPMSPRYQAVSRTIVACFSEPTSSTLTDEELRHVWSLTRRYAATGFDISRFNVLNAAIKSARLVRLEASSMLPLIVKNIPYGDMRSTLLCSPGLPEELARDLVRQRVQLRGDSSDQRLSIVRRHHYEHNDELLREMSSAELDKMIASLPADVLGQPTTLAVEDPEALTILAQRSDIDPYALDGLCMNPHLSNAQIEMIIDTHGLGNWHWPGSLMPDEVYQLMVHPATDDSQLARIVDGLDDGHDSHKHRFLTRLAALHPSSGDAVFQALKNHPYTNEADSAGAWSRNFDDLTPPWSIWAASASPSRVIQAHLATRAIGESNMQLAACLMQNGTLRRNTFDELQQAFPMLPSQHYHLESRQFDEIGPRHIPRSTKFPYELKDLAELAIADELRPGAAEEVIGSLIDEEQLGRTIDDSLLTRLADADLMTARQAAQIMSHPDVHVALSFATHPRLRESGAGYRSPHIRELAATADALLDGLTTLPDDKGINSWRQLPHQRDSLLPRTELHSVIDGQLVDGLRLRVPTRRSEVVGLSERMRNCLAGYVDSLEAGTDVLAVAETPGDIYAVMWRVRSRALPRQPLDGLQPPQPEAQDQQRYGVIRVREMNSSFNRGLVPPTFEQAIHELTQRINDGTLEPAELEPAELDPGSTRRRAPRRVALPTLLGPNDAGTTDLAAPRPEVAPNVLGTSMDDGREIATDLPSNDVEQQPAADRPGTEHRDIAF